MVYVDKNLNYLKDLDLSSNEKQESSYDGRNGVRSIRISPDGKHLASGDRSGNIRVHDTATLQEVLKVEAHDAEVLCLEYTGNSDHKLMASASRDRLIHVFDVNNVRTSTFFSHPPAKQRFLGLQLPANPRRSLLLNNGRPFSFNAWKPADAFLWS